MKIKLIVAILLSFINCDYGQGFINLNFEQAKIIINPDSTISTSNAAPGWTAYYSGTPMTEVLYNTTTLGAAAVSIQGTNGSYPAIQGKYFILLQGEGVNFGNNSFITNSASIGQTGQIPFTAQSLVFWGQSSSIGGPNTGIQITFNNQQVLFNTLNSTANYNIYGADISVYAGQIGELLFTAPYNTVGFIDNIQFSSTAVPEPSKLALFGLAVTALHLYRRRNF